MYYSFLKSALEVLGKIWSRSAHMVIIDVMVNAT